MIFINWHILSFSLSYHAKSRAIGVNFRIVVVYGSPYDSRKEAFLFELHSVFVDCSVPTLIGGDFNQVRSCTNKSNGNVNLK